jgi:hypothetical protein
VTDEAKKEWRAKGLSCYAGFPACREVKVISFKELPDTEFRKECIEALCEDGKIRIGPEYLFYKMEHKAAFME